MTNRDRPHDLTATPCPVNEIQDRPLPNKDAGVGWSTAASTVWGKTDPVTGSWLPLVQHLDDSRGVGGALFDHWLSTSQRDFLAEAVGSPESARSMATFLCAIHDIGKCAPSFSFKAADIFTCRFLIDQMRRAGFDMTRRPTAPVATHGVVGQWWIQHKLGSLGMKPRPARRIAGIVGGHHGRNPGDQHIIEVARRPDQTADGTWEDVREEIWQTMLTRTGAHQHLPDWIDRTLPIAAQTCLAALVIAADWMASDTRYFPYDNPCDPQRLATGLALLDLPAPWRPTPVEDIQTVLHRRFPHLQGHQPQPIQVAAVEAANNLLEPAMIIIEAPMGSGKTEAAMLTAEVLATRFGQGGIFFGLPTMATANPMYLRVSDWLQRTTNDTAVPLKLVHGRAALVEPLLAKAGSDTSVNAITDDELSPSEAIIEVGRWFHGRKRAGLATHVVATIDQCLYAALKAKHVALRHLALWGKIVIVDEVHAADDYMRAYLCRTLEWLAALHVPVILMSATLPTAQRNELASAYAYAHGRRTGPVTSSPDFTYPRLSVVTETIIDVPVPPTTRTTSVAIRPHSNDTQAIADTLTTVLDDGGCAGVICNSIPKAQEIFTTLAERFNEDVVLLHSKFVAQHRTTKEAELMAALGPNGNRPHRLIVVGTQVLEQSLDIDFDVLLTDIAPMDLLLQRIGRLHRHQRGTNQQDRPTSLRSATCYLLGIQDWVATPPTIDPRTVYQPSRILRTLAVLGLDPTAIVLPTQIPDLIENAYHPDLQPPTRWQPAWAEADHATDVHRQDQVARAQTFLMASPTVKDNLDDLVLAGASDPDDPRNRDRPQVRDSDETLQVIAIRRDHDGTIRAMDGIGPSSGKVIPMPLSPHDGTLARDVAMSTITLPRQCVCDAAIKAIEDQFDASPWQSSPWLAGELILIFGPDNQARILDSVLHYDPILGLHVMNPTMTDTDAPTPAKDLP